jgi:hypothetical protein
MAQGMTEQVIRTRRPLFVNGDIRAQMTELGIELVGEPGQAWLGVPLLACLVTWGWWRGAVSVRESRRELAELVERRDHLREANRTLARDVEALRREREARARAAREALDVVSPAEAVVVPPPAAAPPATLTAPAATRRWDGGLAREAGLRHRGRAARRWASLPPSTP